ncbi:hypothetical protein PVBG_04779 [Plasmodium vivax Brazil I]|uniref:Variable surface protein n=1 Tax=Plasmodium vivax (strain Brazil I) TaxID=1033975 RepID=A0A0J9SZK3_PLAV1|nr:hypothetical protein PVBG_04779 [Plasmodium vivax Brazil I]
MFIENIDESKYPRILSYCDNADMFNKVGMSVYKPICKKLTRNLLLLAENDYKGDELYKCCNILYIWLYFEIINKDLSDDTVKIIFDESNKLTKLKLQKTPCHYFTFKKKLHDPEDLIELRIFNDNIENIQKALLDESDNHRYDSYQRYVTSCFNKYERIKENYCIQGKDKETNNVDTCNELKQFESHYSCLTQHPNIKNKIPTLDSPINTTIDIERCKSNEIGETSPNVVDGQSGSTIQRSVNTVIFTMAGVSSTLAVLYRVNINFHLNI